jgi:hypothetical protein
MNVRQIVDGVGFTSVICGFSGVLGYAAGRLVEGAPDAGLWVQAASSLCLLDLPACRFGSPYGGRRPPETSRGRPVLKRPCNVLPGTSI